MRVVVSPLVGSLVHSHLDLATAVLLQQFIVVASYENKKRGHILYTCVAAIWICRIGGGYTYKVLPTYFCGTVSSPKIRPI